MILSKITKIKEEHSRKLRTWSFCTISSMYGTELASENIVITWITQAFAFKDIHISFNNLVQNLWH